MAIQCASHLAELVCEHGLHAKLLCTKLLRDAHDPIAGDRLQQCPHHCRRPVFRDQGSEMRRELVDIGKVERSAIEAKASGDVPISAARGIVMPAVARVKHSAKHRAKSFGVVRPATTTQSELSAARNA
jgi:hypothetical protein